MILRERISARIFSRSYKQDKTLVFQYTPHMFQLDSENTTVKNILETEYKQLSIWFRAVAVTVAVWRRGGDSDN